MVSITLRGSRQCERARHVIKQLNNLEKARFCDEKVLCLSEQMQHEAVLQWVKDETLAKGALVTLIHYQQDCDCPGGYSDTGTKKCQGHDDFFICPFSGHPLRFWLDEWKNSKTCNGVVGYLNGIRIGEL